MIFIILAPEMTHIENFSFLSLKESGQENFPGRCTFLYTCFNSY